MKKLLKSTVAVLLACAMLIPGVISFAAEPISFNDVEESDWFAPYVDYCSRNGLVYGMTGTTFEPETSLSRAMFVTILYRSVNAEPTEGATMPFIDIPELYWGREPILWAYENEIVNGMTPTTFRPDDKITREQMCTILCRFADAMGYEMPSSEGAFPFEDDSSISEYAYDSVYSCAAAEIVNGITETTFGPKQYATRAQACTILMRFIRYTTTTYTETESENGKVSFEYADKYGVYASGYEITDENGNITESYYQEEGYWDKTVNVYNEKGDLTESKYTASDGYEYTETYKYDDSGNLTEYKFVDSDDYEDNELYTYNENGDLTEYKYVNSYGYEEYEKRTYNENGDLTLREYNDSYDYEETETYTYNENGDVTEHKFTDSYDYEYTETYTYNEKGDITEYLYEDTDGATKRVVYEYNDDGLISGFTSNADGVTSEAEFQYIEGTDRIGKYIMTGSDGLQITVEQGYSEDGYFNYVNFLSAADEEQVSYTFKYDENGVVTYLKLEDVNMSMESVDGSFVDGLPTKLSMTDGELVYNVTVDWEAGTVEVTDGDATDTEESGMAILAMAMLVALAESYEEITPDNAADLAARL